MKKYNLSLLFTVATLMLGACQSPIKIEKVDVENKIEQDSSVEVAESQSTSKVTPIKTTYYDKSLFVLPIDHPYWETTTLDKDTIQELKERYGFIDEEVTVENDNSEEESKGVSSEKNNGSEKESTENTTESTSKPTTNQNVSTSTNNSSSVSKPNNNNNKSSSSTNQPTTPPVVEEKPQPQPPVQPSEPAPQPTPPVVEQPSEPTPQPTPPVEETKKPVDLLDWNYIKSTLIAKGDSLGLPINESLNRENTGYESPWQSSYMTVTNEDVIGYIGTQMERIASAGVPDYNLEMVVQSDGHVLIYLIR